jgi:HTH-type transcriptional regulator, sugar sensing transcriptional regulator
MNTQIELEEVLQKIGLGKPEAKIYLTLLKLQEAQTGSICKETGIPSSNIYTILNALIQKGIISYKLRNNIKIFMPASPQALNEFITQKQKQLDDEKEIAQDLINKLKKQPLEKDYISSHKFFEGTTGIKSMWHELNSTMDTSESIRTYTSTKEGFEKLIPFYDEHHNLRLKKGVHEFEIFPMDATDLAKKRRNNITQVRHLPLKNIAEWGVIKDNFYVYYLIQGKPIAFLIKDKIIAQTFKQVFDQVWETAKEK